MADIIIGYIINIVDSVLIIVMASWIANNSDDSDHVTDFVCVVCWAFAICLGGCATYDFLEKIIERI